MQELQVSNKPNRTQLLRSLCKESLYYFLVYFWDTIATNKLVDNWHIKAICDEIQPSVLKALKGEKKDGDIIINICPGTTKSTIISQMLPAWCWAVYPKSVIISSTGTAQLTAKNSMKSRDIIQSEKYLTLFPEVIIRKDASAKTFYQNKANGTRYAFTTKGNPIGNHAHLILIDDPESQKDARNETMMEYSSESIKALSTRMVDKESTLRILLMQRLTEIDSTSVALKKFTNPKHICLPAVLTDNVKPLKFRDNYIDGLLDVNRLSYEILEEERKKLNNDEEGSTSFDYDAQFLQDPKNPEGLLFQNINTFSVGLDEFRNVGEDFSFTDVADRGEDYLCTIFAKIYNESIYVYDVIYTQASSATYLPIMVDRFEYYNTGINVIESNNQGSVVATYLEEKGFFIKSLYSSGKKETRIKTSSFYVKDIQFLKPEDSLNDEYKIFMNAIRKYPANCIVKHDDSADALAILIKFFRINYPNLFK
mgnify:CR=1 FL=1